MKKIILVAVSPTKRGADIAKELEKEGNIVFVANNETEILNYLATERIDNFIYNPLYDLNKLTSIKESKLTLFEKKKFLNVGAGIYLFKEILNAIKNSTLGHMKILIYTRASFDVLTKNKFPFPTGIDYKYLTENLNIQNLLLEIE